MNCPKFKAFHLAERRWLDLTEWAIDPASGSARVVVYDDSGARLLGSNKFLVVVQATGCQEPGKSEREIYEGDVVSDGQCWYVVDFKDGEFYMRSLDKKLDLRMRALFIERVIGNIYENPELLEERS